MLDIDIHTHSNNFELKLKAHFPDRGITAIFGPSGSGKSTLLDIIAAFKTPSKASKVIFNQTVWLDSDGYNMPIENRRVAYITQRPCLFEHLNVLENINYAATRSLVTTTSNHIYSPAAVIEKFELKSLLHKKTTQLSGGEQQRLAIARAVASNPQLLLFDEPLSALDDASRERILTQLELLHDEIDIPILYVTHNLEEVMRLADSIALLENGQLIAHNSLDNILSDLSLPLCLQQNTGVVVTAKTQYVDEQFNLCYSTTDDGFQFIVPSNQQNININSPIRLRIYAKDVSITLSKTKDSSILNVLPVVIEQIENINESQAMLKLRCGEQTLLSLITRKSVQHLALKTKKNVFAQIKGIAVLSRLAH